MECDQGFIYFPRSVTLTLFQGAGTIPSVQLGGADLRERLSHALIQIRHIGWFGLALLDEGSDFLSLPFTRYTTETTQNPRTTTFCTWNSVLVLVRTRGTAVS